MTKFKVGDKVFIVYYVLGSSRKNYYQLTTIVSISAKRGDIRLKDHKTIYGPSGDSKKSYDKWSTGPHLELATPELIAELNEKHKRERLVNSIQEFDFETISTTNLEKIVALTKAATEEENIENTEWTEAQVKS
jgi:hypothetical protein